MYNTRIVMISIIRQIHKTRNKKMETPNLPRKATENGNKRQITGRYAECNTFLNQLNRDRNRKQNRLITQN